jgi:hypothetical protein
MKKLQVMMWVCGLLLSVAVTARGDVLPLTLVPKDFNDLGSLEPISGWGAMTTVLENVAGKLRGEMTSQPFLSSGTGDYYYLYQLENAGNNVSWNIIEVSTVTPFTGAGSLTVAGYLTANQPAAFVAGTEIPAGASVNTDAGPTISFGFPGFINPISPGETTKVLYIKSGLSPDLIQAYIINGSVAQGDVIGPVPEPATMGLLGLGSVMLLGRNGRKRK